VCFYAAFISSLYGVVYVTWCSFGAWHSQLGTGALASGRSKRFSGMSQTWPLSQDANKSSGTCSVCLATRQLHNRDGTVHKHGPRDSPCPGSNKPPLSVSMNSTSAAASSASSASLASAVGSASVVQNVSQVQSPPIWSPPDFTLVKHIPKSARAACASHLATLLRSVASNPGCVSKWIGLVNWGGAILHPPKRGGKRHNLAASIKDRISSFKATASPGDLSGQEEVKRTRTSGDSRLSQAVSAKLEDGNIRAAIRLLMSEDTPAAPSAESFDKLSQKHPPASVSAADLPCPSQGQCLSVDEAEVRRAVLSFPAGSAGGPDGLRPQHIRDMLLCREAGSEFLTALTAFVNMVLSGRCPSEVAPVFFGGRLLALNKKSGGIRPIAIGFTLRRLTSKCANVHGVNHLKSFFQPRQLGVGTPGGCEAAIHSARRYLEAMPSGHVMVKLDFTNAFNSLHRHDMLMSVLSRVPELYAYCHSAYSQPSKLFYGGYIISSAEGPQQGDPLGPLLFSNTIQPLLLSMNSELNLGYLDDVTLAGPADIVASDVAEIIQGGSALGLSLNTEKCELIAHHDFALQDPVLQQFKRVDIGAATLLGAPLFSGTSLDEAWLTRCDDLARATDRLRLLSAQDALILLRSSFSAPRVLHLLRCSPSVSHPSLQSFDSLLRTAVQSITNSVLTDLQWIQASLPVKDGGLGIRRVSSLALPAFLASAAGTLCLQDDILSGCAFSDSIHLQTYLSDWSSKFGDLPEVLPPKQPFWDRPGILVDQTLVRSSLTSPPQVASFLAASSPHSGDWLFALPITSCGLRLDDEAVRIAVGLRLGLPLCVPHQCRCGSQVDACGQHSFVCKRAPGRSARHHALNDLIARAIASAGTPVTKEPQGLLRSDGKRPDGLTLIPWQAGKALSWDVTVVYPLAESYLQAASQEAGAVAEIAATRKSAKYAQLEGRYIFQPIAVESLGPINSSASTFLSFLGRRVADISGEVREGSFLFQRLSVLIQRYNAVLLHDSFIDEEAATGIPA